MNNHKEFRGGSRCMQVPCGWLSRARGNHGGLYQRFGKRALDLGLGLALGIILAPVQIAVAGVVGVAVGRPIIFRQIRPGLNNKPFEILKFRTMTDERDADGELLPDEARITRVGRAMRGASLDELPEIYNVIRGDMSLVGPRPLLMKYVDRYTTEQARRAEVRPGVTGLAQVSGRNHLTWDEKFALDVEYVDAVSFRLDIKILALTVWNVLRQTGIAADGHATAPEFVGATPEGGRAITAPDGALDAS